MTDMPSADPRCRRSAAIRGEATDTLVFANRLCSLRDYEEIAVPSFDVDGEFVAYASPEAIYAVTKAFMQGARVDPHRHLRLHRGVHEEQPVQLLHAAGGQVSLMLDLVGDDEAEIFEDLAASGARPFPRHRAGGSPSTFRRLARRSS